MNINFTNINFEKDINLPENIQTLNNDIKKMCHELPALNIVKDINLLDYTIEQTEKFKRNKKKFVVFGTGGSNLGARALINTLIEQPKNILFFDNIDPLFFQNEIINLDLNTTGFIVISKSGTTPETLSQFGSIVNIAREKNNLDMLFKNSLVVTEFKDSPLFNIAKKNNFEFFIVIYPWAETLEFGQEKFNWSKFVSKLCSEINCKVVDAIPEFQKYKEENINWSTDLFFLNDEHFNKDGANLLFKSIKKTQKIRGGYI